MFLFLFFISSTYTLQSIYGISISKHGLILSVEWNTKTDFEKCFVIFRVDQMV